MFRIGKSTDIHRLITNRPLIIGGVRIESDLGLLGHSDADVLLHAVAEAILGALALGDLGTHFPDTSSEFKNIDSKIILKDCYKMMSNLNYEINNLDCMVMLERPKLKDYIFLMRQNISGILNTNINNVSIKATRGEGLGFVGERLGAIAEAVVLLKKI